MCESTFISRFLPTTFKLFTLKFLTFSFAVIFLLASSKIPLIPFMAIFSWARSLTTTSTIIPLIFLFAWIWLHSRWKLFKPFSTIVSWFFTKIRKTMTILLTFLSATLPSWLTAITSRKLLYTIPFSVTISIPISTLIRKFIFTSFFTAHTR